MDSRTVMNITEEMGVPEDLMMTTEASDNTTSSTTTTTIQPTDNPKLSDGAIVGIVLGVAAFIIIIIIAMFCYCKRANNRKRAKPMEPATPPKRRLAETIRRKVQQGRDRVSHFLDNFTHHPSPPQQNEWVPPIPAPTEPAPPPPQPTWSHPTPPPPTEPAPPPPCPDAPPPKHTISETKLNVQPTLPDQTTGLDDLDQCIMPPVLQDHDSLSIIPPGSPDYVNVHGDSIPGHSHSLPIMPLDPYYVNISTDSAQNVVAHNRSSDYVVMASPPPEYLTMDQKEETMDQEDEPSLEESDYLHSPGYVNLGNDVTPIADDDDIYINVPPSTSRDSGIMHSDEDDNDYDNRIDVSYENTALNSEDELYENGHIHSESQRPSSYVYPDQMQNIIECG